ncbi:hypothetical protein HMPREF1317_0749 [Schaalia georgiae F0490]|uniref:Uncharacterized protein n=1 Tax=Schaalia georgiae F0490 TaxID=1125717 RepID=J1GQP9_9ACTO|nr:hypothetical protein HMPREF1317_0749 [Schaalia georgiae F0490]
MGRLIHNNRRHSNLVTTFRRSRENQVTKEQPPLIFVWTNSHTILWIDIKRDV